MAVPTSITTLSTTASSNPPAGSTSIGAEGIDNHFRAGYSFIAQLYAEKAPLADPTFTGTVNAAALTTTGNTILGNAATDTLNVGSGGLIKNASGNVGIGIDSTGAKLQIKHDTAVSSYGVQVDSYESATFKNSSLWAWNGTDDELQFGNYQSFPVTFIANNIVRIGIEADGRLYGTALHDNSGAVTGTTKQYIASGTYTPTLTNATGATSSTARIGQWTRIGNVVTVSGTLEASAASTGAYVNVGISLPIASDFTSIYQLSGCGAVKSSAAAYSQGQALIKADTTNNRADMHYLNVLDVGDVIHYTFQYVVV